MNERRPIERMAVCSWSLQPDNTADLLHKLNQTGLSRVQLALDPLRTRAAEWSDCAVRLKQANVTIVSGMFGCVGEDYSTLESILKTGGIAPDETWEQNLENVRSTASLADQLKLNLVTFHAGFLPHEESDPAFVMMLQRLRLVADIFAAKQIVLGLETGQETAASLIGVLQKLDRPNVGVNFDPANMILYDKGDPIEALRLLGPWIRQIHVKDAVRTKTPGTWGQEVCVGTGDVNWREFFVTLKSLNYTGDFVIEREAGGQRIEDIRAARQVAEQYAA